jgi:hypothetical protein
MAASGSLWLWSRNIVLTVVILTFVVFLVPSDEPVNRELAAEIDGERVNMDVYRFHRGRFDEQERDYSQRGIDAKMSRDYFDRQALEILIARYVLAQKARDLGFEVSDAEVRDAVCAAAMFQSEGRCNRQQVEAFAQNIGFDDVVGYTEMIRRSLLVQKFRRLTEQSVRVSDAAAPTTSSPSAFSNAPGKRSPSSTGCSSRCRWC